MIILFAGVRGYLDQIPVSDIARFEQKLLENIHMRGNEILETIRIEQVLSPQTEERIKVFLKEFITTFI